jgi:cysteine-rich repeat protein
VYDVKPLNSDVTPTARSLLLAVLLALGGCMTVPGVSPGECGDGMHNPSMREECDDAGDSATCDGDCTFVKCGDGHINAEAGESCDDGDQEADDGCSADCRREGCGNGVLEPDEACDDGGQVSGDGCSADCRSIEICGNGIVDVGAGEECDGAGETVQCNLDCTLVGCGDGVVNAVLAEPCDTAGDSAACNANCTPVACGDGWRNAPAGEACDDGNQVSGDGCSPACQLEGCGNGMPDPGEVCDDGNRVSGDGCRADCGSDETCGNGLVDAGERCDDGDQVSGDGCRADCGSDETCGNGIVDSSMDEECDDGNRVSGDGCSAICQLDASCGNGVVNPDRGEQCDDAGESATCDADCTIARCGDGMRNATAGETCDDAGESPSCDANCTAVRCGDGDINAAAGEQCDDGGQVSGDGCSASCRLEYCGNGAVDPGEQCDDGGQVSGDGCSADCHSDETCGNGVVDAAQGEQCDDAGQSASCDSDCTLALCGDGAVNVLAAESCDEGGADTATCNWNCTVPSCGDGQVNLAAGEQCETGGESLYCDPDCTFAWCGDGWVNATRGEPCDGGGVDTDTCNENCTPVLCGDGHVNLAAGEDCETDDGDTASCDGDCTFVSCGDRWVNAAAGEACDEGGDSDACDSDCTPVVCGDEHVNLAAGEECDTGGGEAPSCDGDCTLAWCGDGVINESAFEECDDGNADDSDWCRVTCEAASCDDGIRNGDEQGMDCGGHCEPCREVDAMVVAGEYHTCALLETGAVRCWGNSGNGQLGYGNTNNIGDNESPVTAGDVNVGGVVVQLAAGEYHTCALLETGAVRCWGVGTTGQLGYGNTNRIGDDETPAAAGDVNVGGVVVQLAAGGYHTCALLETGAVRCWGHGGNGRLGYGNTNNIGDNEAPATAGNVNVGGVVAQLAAGGEHTCALLETGAVRCWGDGTSGQLGYGNTTNIGDNEAPATVGNVNVGGVVAQLAAGVEHTCALLETGAVRCWGWGFYGQLGYGNTNTIGDTEAPATAGNVNVGGVVAQLAAGWARTCALLETGAVRCWGDGLNGQLGYGNTNTIGDTETPATAGNVNVGGVVVQLAAGGTHTCTLLGTGAVRCWGSGLYGRLGYGNTSNIGDNETPASAGDVLYR